VSVRSENLSKISARIAELRRDLKPGAGRGYRLWVGLRLWAWMLYHEFQNDDVNVRAQSLAFLTLFSILPLIAGAFFVFAFFSRFGMVQDALQRFIDNFLSTIPAAHREYVRDYILQFKDSYLENITQTSGSVGVFALLVLAWVGLQAFNNIDETLNYIWSAERVRRFHEKVGNFIVVVVLAPMVLIAGFSVPLILARVPITRFFLDHVPALGVLLNYVIPSALVLATFFCMYRFLPVCRVWWKSALAGALFSTFTLWVVNALMGLYFAFGTNSAYGKAAVIPLVGFWIYALWVVVILGAEVSFLLQNGRDIGARLDDGPSFSSGRSLLVILVELQRAYQSGQGPLSLERLRDVAGNDSATARAVVDHLVETGMVAEVISDEEGGQYTLARTLDGLEVGTLLRGFYRLDERRRSAVDKLWHTNLAAWLKTFDKTRLTDLASSPASQL